MLIVTTGSAPGREVAEVPSAEVPSLVRGSTVRAKHVGADIVAMLRNLVGAEVKQYARLLAARREQALDRMCASARGTGANAILAVRM